jgi:hypothetical protein
VFWRQDAGSDREHDEAVETAEATILRAKHLAMQVLHCASYYRMCSLTIECVLLPSCAPSTSLCRYSIVSVYVPLIVSVYVSVYAPLIVSVHVPLIVSVYMSVYVPLIVSVYVPLIVSVYAPLIVSVYVPLIVSVYVCICALNCVWICALNCVSAFPSSLST